MREKRPVRIIKREQRARAKASPEAPHKEHPAASEREVRTVVSSWVREHSRRSEEFRRSFAKLLREAGFQPSRITGRA